MKRYGGRENNNGRINKTGVSEYLGQLMSFHEEGKNDINKRIHRGWSNL